MDIFHVLTMLGGLCLFLFGMNFMGQSLERRAGGKLRTLLDKMTGSVGAGFLTGLGITAIIQSSSATTVMVVGFVNSGLMNLRQAINVIMGANVGTTVTAWLLSLAGIDGGSTWVQLLKPTSFTPVLALIGIIFYMFCKDSHKKDTGAILLGFATLMFGMDTMSGAVAGLKDVPGFAELFLAFTNPLLGVLVGAVLTAVIQSSSASVGILQALASTGQVSYAAAVPIIMGQNIGTCVTALISCVGTNKNAKRAAVVHLMFNVIGVAVLLTVFCIVKAIFAPALLNESASMAGIAIAHSAFNILCTAHAAALRRPAGKAGCPSWCRTRRRRRRRWSWTSACWPRRRWRCSAAAPWPATWRHRPPVRALQNALRCAGALHPGAGRVRSGRTRAAATTTRTCWAPIW